MKSTSEKSYIVPLNLPVCELKIKKEDGVNKVFDINRKKWFQITPEEWVRQHFMHYLINEIEVPLSLIENEKALRINNLDKRADIVVNNTQGKPILIVECKAPEIKIDQKTFDQIARYNLTLDVKYLVVTNGLDHYICTLDRVNETYNYLQDIPNFKNL